MKSLLRIIFGVLIGISILFGIFLFFSKLPSKFFFLILAWPVAFMSYMVFKALHEGRISAKGSIYERHKNPFGFWFYILFYSFVILFFLVWGACSLFNVHLI